MTTHKLVPIAVAWRYRSGQGNRASKWLVTTDLKLAEREKTAGNFVESLGVLSAAPDAGEDEAKLIAALDDNEEMEIVDRAIARLADLPTSGDAETRETIRESHRLIFRLAILETVAALKSHPAPPAQDERSTDGWMPIGTAPLGVKIIAGYRNASGKWRTITARYFEPNMLEGGDQSLDEFAPEGWYEESETHDELMACTTPTHWQPLPTEPGQADTIERGDHLPAKAEG